MSERGRTTPRDGYDGANRLAKTWTDISGQDVDHPLVSYTYDAFGNQQTVTTRSDSSTSRATSYTYDSANRVTKIEYPGALVGDEGFGYDEAGGLLWKKDGNGKFTLYQYDDLHRLIAVYYLPGALPNPISYEGLTADVTYTYNGGTSQREKMVDAAGTSAFEYDSQVRLKTDMPPLGLDTGYYVQYAYNNAGQKTGVKIWNGTTASYDVSYEYYANGWLKAVKSGAQTIASYSCDDNGALTAVKTADGQTEQQTFTYDATGLMNTATFNNQTQTLTNLWDADEHRVQFSIGEDEYTSVFDVTAGIPAVIKEITPTETIYYVREPGGELLAMVHPTAGIRFYDPETGRFERRDPVPAVSRSGYAYGDGNPLAYIDATGRNLTALMSVGAAAILDWRCLVDAFDIGDAFRRRDNILKSENHFMAHCMAACKATRCFNLTCLQAPRVFLLGLVMEAYQWTPLGKPGGGGWGNRYWSENAGWNADGIAMAFRAGTCFSNCYREGKARSLSE